MDTRSEEFKSTVYDVMCGTLRSVAEYTEDEIRALTPEQMKRAEIIKNLQKLILNEYAENSLCEKKYEEIFEVNQKLCKRLGVVEEDEDVECIINNFFDITRHLCLKMYDYGVLFGMHRDADSLLSEAFSKG